jgi:tyrosyl-tRNA synthetase
MSKNKPVGLHEFLYPLMVGYDSVVLDVDCEIGGTDQEFNMLAGRTLQQAYDKRDKFVLTVPLLEGTDGRKMSKSYENCVYLDEKPREMFGKLLSIKDELIVKYMHYCTDIPLDEIAKAEKEMKGGANPKDYKVLLAKEIVAMYHSTKEADQVEEEFQRVFKEGGLPDDMPEATVKKNDTLIDVLVEQGLIASKSEARRLVDQGGIHLNNQPITSIEATVEEGIAKVGKRKFLKLSLR